MSALQVAAALCEAEDRAGVVLEPGHPAHGVIPVQPPHEGSLPSSVSILFIYNFKDSKLAE